MDALRTLVPWIAVIVLVAGCTAAPPATAPTQPAAAASTAPVAGGKLVVANDIALASLDPARTSGANTKIWIQHIFDTLVEYDMTQPNLPYMPLRPGLAESWTVSPDGLTYTFKLRSGVKFHDGKPFTSAAAKATFDRALDANSSLADPKAKAGLTSLLGQVASAAAPDPQTLSVTLKAPFASFLTVVADQQLSIIDPDQVTKGGLDAIEQAPNGTGPFKFTSRDDKSMTLTRNADYWGAKPYLDTVNVVAITDDATRAAALKAGEVDYVLLVGLDQIASLQSTPTVKIDFASPPSPVFWMLNTRDGATANKLVRQALNYAIDREAIVKNIYAGAGARPLGGPIPVGNPAYDASLDIYSYNPEKAKQLIAQSGVPLPIKLPNLILPSAGGSSSAFTLAADVLQQQLKAVGVEVTFDRLEVAASIAKARPGFTAETAGHSTSWTTNTHDLFWIEQLYGKSFHPPAGAVRGWYDNPKVNELLNTGRGEPDQAKRVGIYREVAKLIADDAPWLWIVQDKYPRGYGTNVQGLLMMPSYYFDLTKVWIKK
jgi:ABC-type transport system substrate-binding protein